MLATSQSPDLHAFRRATRQLNASPSFRTNSCHQGYDLDPNLLTPSRTRSRRSQADDSAPAGSPDDFFLQSPFKSPQPPTFGPVSLLQNNASPKPRYAQPTPHLLTPLRHAANNNTCPQTPVSTSRTNAGVKRKSASLTTPLRQHNLTPLKIAPSKGRASDVSFDRLVAPDFSRTPNPKRDVDMNVGRHTASLRKLNLSDLNDSGCEMDLSDGSDVDMEDNTAAWAFKAVPYGKGAGEVAEAISPDGHITKRRARTRPISSELLETLPRAGSSKMKVQEPSNRRKSPRQSSSSSESGSPLFRQRLSSGIGTKPRIKPSRPSAPVQLSTTRAPFQRVDSATLFFGPAVHSAKPPQQSTVIARPKMMSRHSYGGSSESIRWHAMQTRSLVSPQSSPMSEAQADDTDDEDMTFERLGPNTSFSADTSFSFSDSGSPTLRSPTARTPLIAKKYKPRDSGVVVSDDDDIFSSDVPQASTSVSSIYSDGEGLVTPGVIPHSSSRWPFPPGIADDDADSMNGVDAFIQRTLVAATSKPEDSKRIPGTPVKKIKTTSRPWQSAFTHKVGLNWDEKEKKKGKIPRISLPAMLSRNKQGPKSPPGRTPVSESDHDTEPEDSPSSKKYPSNLGVGRPTLLPLQPWLGRRSSSGALSSGSESMTSVVGTPSRKGAWNAMDISPLRSIKAGSPCRSTSGSSSSTINSPTVMRSHGAGAKLHRASASSLSRHSPSLTHFGRFERDFLQVGEVGTGEFGQVIKVQRKDGPENEVYAIKKSKRFEGMKHRIRLREEVDILKHLSNLNGGESHANVLAFIDSWEEGDVLYIQTELCESGNLAHFLWEYGRKFPRLEEARLWKIVAELSNGLRFIHDAGVIHLDIKPANVFITTEGRFKIGDFGMASIWPPTTQVASFEREGDKSYLAPEVLQGTYGKAADIFSFGMTMLETAANIVVPDQGDAWQRLRREDFVQVDLDDSPELFELIQRMMRRDPSMRVDVHTIFYHPAVARARASMEALRASARKNGTSIFAASPLASISAGLLDEILGRRISNSGVGDVNRGVSRAF